MKKKKPDSKNKISDKEIQEFLKNSKINQCILWLFNIPKEEWSDSMLQAYSKMQSENQNEIWLIDYFDTYLQKEIEEFIKWNDDFLKVGVYDDTKN